MAIREATLKDYDKLVTFWNQNSGWDIITKDIWEDRFINAPYGPSVVLIVESKQKILAMLIFILFKVTLGQKEVNGCRPFAAIADKSIRKISGMKYIGQLINKGFKTMKEKGNDIMIMLPDPRWKRHLRLIRINSYEFPLFKKLLVSDFKYSKNTELFTKIIDFENHEINDLWNKVQNQNVYMISRYRKILKWKNSHRDYKIIGIYQNNKLLGIATYLEKVQDKQIQICDVLIADLKNQEKVFTQISRFLNSEYKDNLEYKKIVILVTKSIRKSLINVGFEPDDYNFLFCIKRLNKNISIDTLNISNWYLSAND